MNAPISKIPEPTQSLNTVKKLKDLTVFIINRFVILPPLAPSPSRPIPMIVFGGNVQGSSSAIRVNGAV
jgi:hypothetical protein